MFCSKCGKAIDDDSNFCIYCGKEIQVVSNTNMSTKIDDQSNTGLNVISFFLPIVGLILYIIYHEKTPIKASAAGRWAIVGFIAGIIVWVCYSAMIASTFSYY